MRINILTITMLTTCLATAQTQADIIVTVTESGSDVLWSGSGSFDTTVFPSNNSGPPSGFFNLPTLFNLGTGTSRSYIDTWAGPTSLPGSSSPGILPGTGDAFGWNPGATNLQLFLPTGYTSGDSLAGTTTIAGESFASLGLTVGDTVWTHGSGQTLTLSVTGGAAAVPEPSSLALLGLGGIGFVCYRRKRLPNAA